MSRVLTDKATRHTLIQRLKGNDEADWQVFYDSYQGFIFVIIQRMGLSYHDSEELKQDILLKAWKAIPDFDYDPSKGKFRWWLARIVKNTVYNFMLKEQRYKEKLANAKVFQKGSVADDFDKKIEVEWQKFVVKKAWEKVSRDFTAEVLLAFTQVTEGRQIEEIARDLGVEENTVYVYKARVQKKLSREIARIDYELNC